MTNRLSMTGAAFLVSGANESVTYLNCVTCELWNYINEAGTKMTRMIAKRMFKEMLPGPLPPLNSTKIYVQTKPILLGNIVVHSNYETVIKPSSDVMWGGIICIKLAANMTGRLVLEGFN